MTDYKLNDWARKIPVSEFAPLGNQKLDMLIAFICANNNGRWFENGTPISNARAIQIVKNDRRYASLLYTVYKHQIEAFTIEQAININESSKQNPIKKKKAKAKKKKEITENIIDFAAFKKSKLG